ncbi:reverse transcriptase domain-containing protein [Tanacetum coccineum]|uniref:Reverse transcriptase domain-containing protein n=1 Tax=Tanacetum coccineum TaxID=301880 RepID=A0ABQ5HUJ0_9ASTR
MYENFNAPSIELLDSIFNRLQKIVSQNKPDLDSMSFDDLYNNFKIVEQEVKRTVTSSSNSGSQNVAFVLTPSSTNEVNTANVHVLDMKIGWGAGAVADINEDGFSTLNSSYEIELADEKVVSTNTILRSCTLVLCNHVFKIDLLPTRLGSFDVIVGMDWLSYHQAVIECYEKIVHIPLLNDKILEVQGERPEKDLRSLACIKADEKSLMTYVLSETSLRLKIVLDIIKTKNDHSCLSFVPKDTWDLKKTGKDLRNFPDWHLHGDT